MRSAKRETTKNGCPSLFSDCILFPLYLVLLSLTAKPLYFYNHHCYLFWPIQNNFEHKKSVPTNRNERKTNQKRNDQEQPRNHTHHIMAVVPRAHARSYTSHSNIACERRTTVNKPSKCCRTHYAHDAHLHVHVRAHCTREAQKREAQKREAHVHAPPHSHGSCTRTRSCTPTCAFMCMLTHRLNKKHTFLSSLFHIDSNSNNSINHIYVT